MNLDTAVSGSKYFNAEGSPSLTSLTIKVAKMVSFTHNTSLYDLWEVKDDHGDPILDTIGDGSDYTVFMHHLGIPSIDIRLKDSLPVYHSVFDSFHWYFIPFYVNLHNYFNRVKSENDVDFAGHEAMARYL